MEQHDVQLSMETVEVTTQYLLVSYQIQNNTNEIIYPTNRIIDYFGPNRERSIPTPELAYVWFKKPNSVTLFQGNSPPPAGNGYKTWTQRGTLHSQVMAGESFRATIRTKCPIVEWHAHSPPEPAPVIPMEVHQVELVVECRLASDARHAYESKYHPQCYLVSSNKFQTLRCIASLPIPCIVLLRTDIPGRQY